MLLFFKKGGENLGGGGSDVATTPSVLGNFLEKSSQTLKNFCSFFRASGLPQGPHVADGTF
ncbi:hypothetical protein [Acidocella sp. MX-AZ02]|uniref:hypothetical protein n=1 Tax=Acidocella sp. MX-AZ02 TaxID=1214225 RepID=UPI000587CB4D|nr:hypothetical protein [Acidocella sp. MX-AZ02]